MIPTMPKEENPQERILAGRILTLCAQSVSESLDRFGGWLLAGFGAAIGLLVANAGTLSKLLRVERLRGSIILFLVAVGLGVLQRLLAALVAGAASVAKESESIGRDIVGDVDLDRFFRELKRAPVYPRRFLEKSLEAVEAGDFAAPGRRLIGIAWIQVLFIVGQLLFSCLSIARLFA
jgi:hypothetical protein